MEPPLPPGDGYVYPIGLETAPRGGGADNPASRIDMAPLTIRDGYSVNW